MQWLSKQYGAGLTVASAAMIGALAAGPGSSQAATEAEMEKAKEWLDEFQPSTLSREEQLKELVHRCGEGIPGYGYAGRVRDDCHA